MNSTDTDSIDTDSIDTDSIDTDSIDTNSIDTNSIDTNSTRAPLDTSIRHGVVAHLTSMNAELISIGPIDTAVAAPLPADLTINNEQEWAFRS